MDIHVAKEAGGDSAQKARDSFVADLTNGLPMNDLSVRLVAIRMPLGQEGDGMQYDTLITGGKVIDGTGNPWFYGDVAIEGERIVAIAPPGRLDPADAARM